MIQLSYHPAFDAFHSIFRFLRLKRRLAAEVLEVEKLRILDYYLMFPWRASGVRLAPRDSFVRALAKRLEGERDYATLPTGELLLERMKPSQTAALQTMAQDGLLDLAQLRNGTVQFTGKSIPDEIASLIESRNGEEEDRLKIVNSLNEYPLLGRDGLKARTALLEHRYDTL